MNNGALLSGKGLSKKYGDLKVVKDVSLSVKAGEFVCLVGKSGCGKTTLLSLLSGLERPTAGQVMLDGKDITSATEDELALFRRQNVGFIFQSFNLIPTLSAWENVALPLFPVAMTERGAGAPRPGTAGEDGAGTPDASISPRLFPEGRSSGWPSPGP